MNKRLLSLAVVGTMVLGLAVSAGAGVPDPTQSSASSNSGTILITPAGLGTSLALKNVIVSVTVIDANLAPIAGYPFQDVVLDDAGTNDISLCPGGSVADANTNALGQTTMSGNISGGGWTQSGMQVYLGGIPLNGLNLDIDVNSPDMNKDRIVNVADVGEFAIDFSGAYAFRSDFIADGTLNIADVGEFAIHNSETCP